MCSLESFVDKVENAFCKKKKKHLGSCIILKFRLIVLSVKMPQIQRKDQFPVLFSISGTDIVTNRIRIELLHIKVACSHIG